MSHTSTKDVPRSDPQAPPPSNGLPNGGVGIGFDLSGTYGTVAISYHNGTTVNVAKINASSPYHETMARLSLHSSQHLHPPYINMDEEWRDYPRQLLRRWRKMRGLPASNDVGALSGMITDLRTEAEKFLGYRISSVVAAVVNLAAIYGEDIYDAFGYAGLEDIQIRPFNYPTYETMAAVAGHGLGLCEHYMDKEACEAEIRPISNMTNVLSVLYTRTALTVSLSRTSVAAWLYEHAPYKLEDFTLGYDARHDNPREEYCWEALRDAIRAPILRGSVHSRVRQPSKVLLFGECSGNPRFRRLLEEEIMSLFGRLPEILDDEPVFVWARGAAEFAKRKPFDFWKDDDLNEQLDL
ncbi:hypothetical protein W97_02744 [Coniosporium apollinis CBS 100218]|uniref:Actin-like ATPase domain-containing protein n=1 Tax=Coniosporium apollinis (strain CBS 100218) TaxID=1168221 RepID=R7YPC5_CONA1|nr:uncharacterized protein W97_02744 [Coniosporium apollinis CBS 100218]EON63516.1 hypothetical protein W97_02744 [Coniosporium apollinis CBS 100218]